jgi:hypothetical protein
MGVVNLLLVPEWGGKMRCVIYILDCFCFFNHCIQVILFDQFPCIIFFIRIDDEFF